MKKNVYLLILLLFFLSCGKSARDNDESESLEEFPEGTYSANLIPVNGKVSTQVNGEVLISRYGDQFIVKVHLKNAPAGLHKQQLHSGITCPSAEHDTNGDGYVDMGESRQYLGDVILPFDGDLSSYHLGSDFTPSGSYRYSRSTSYYLMFSDLDIKEQDLPIEGRVVSIFGISPVGELPIACGVLKKISDGPLPEGEWEEGSSSTSRSTGTGRVRPRPKPPEPEYETPSEPAPSSSWWQRMRERWRNWRSRARDWWNRGSAPKNVILNKVSFKGIIF